MLTTRLISAFVICVIGGIAFFANGWLGASLFLILALIAVWEIFGEYNIIVNRMGSDVKKTEMRVFTSLLIIMIATFPLFCSTSDISPAASAGWEIGILSVFLVYCFLMTFRESDFKKAFFGLAATVTGMVIVYGLLGFIPKLYFLSGVSGNGRWLLLFVLLVTKAGDVGAYSVGTLTSRRASGNHKICPALSPGKSWEGLAGGALGCFLVAIIFYAVGKDSLMVNGQPVLTLYSASLLAFAFAVLGLIGDLAVSFLKRAAQLDNSGRLPGLGGVLDVTDSLLFTVPLFYVYLHI
ncbi:MAG: phosphatidate cytidylyltransferase [Verrucomicrobiota bacterium]